MTVYVAPVTSHSTLTPTTRASETAVATSTVACLPASTRDSVACATPAALACARIERPFASRACLSRAPNSVGSPAGLRFCVIIRTIAHESTANAVALPTAIVYDARMTRKKSPEENFWPKVLKTETCWLWRAAVDKDGYGKFNITLTREGVPFRAKTPQKYVRAHHFAWELHGGDVPTGMVLMHSCDTPACVNPAHLSVGTPKMNYADSQAKGRNTRGSRNPRAKLRECDVLAIRASAEKGIELARRYGVTNGTISAVRSGRIGRHVSESA